MSYKSVPQECPANKNVLQECPTRVPHESVLQECSARVSQKSECHTKFPTRVRKSVPQRFPKGMCPTRVSQKCLLQECQIFFECLFSSACLHSGSWAPFCFIFFSQVFHLQPPCPCWLSRVARCVGGGWWVALPQGEGWSRRVIPKKIPKVTDDGYAGRLRMPVKICKNGPGTVYVLLTLDVNNWIWLLRYCRMCSMYAYDFFVAHNPYL